MSDNSHEGLVSKHKTAIRKVSTLDSFKTTVLRSNEAITLEQYRRIQAGDEVTAYVLTNTAAGLLDW